ncbi:hypothetical protein LTR17_019945 [Elasticomyces elasticus]|nr:hypothetical protein LTR17_019945 [Elasticomyces elasticus]
MHAKASVDGVVIAETSNYQFVEGNVYFPQDSIKDPDSIFAKTDHTTYCPWKGTSSYYDINVNGKTLSNAAWYYPETFEKAAHIKDHVAFYKTKVQIEKE